MQKIQQTIIINASKEKVWNTMLDASTYSIWTKSFSEQGSKFEGSWEQGSEIQFLDGSGQGGMYGRIAENRLHEFISIEYLGIVTNGVVDTSSDEAKKWTPAFENYTFTDVEGGTQLDVDADTLDEYKDMLESLWPKALQDLKELAEKSTTLRQDHRV